jgi:hypothetical protein
VRPIRRWKDDIKMDLEEVGGGDVDWMERTQDRDRWRALVGTVMLPSAQYWVMSTDH